MSALPNFVSLHPYFKVHPGKLEAVKAAFPRFVEKTAIEEKNLFYEFSANGDEIFCREGYTDAEGVLAHLENVGVLLAELLTMGELTRIEVHGPATELEKLKSLSLTSIRRGSRLRKASPRGAGYQFVIIG